MASLPAKQTSIVNVLNSTALNTAVTTYYGHITNRQLSELNKVSSKIAETIANIEKINLEALGQAMRQTALLEYQISHVKLEKLEKERQNQLKQSAFAINAELKTAMSDAPVVRYILSFRRSREAIVVGFRPELLNEISDKEYAYTVETNLKETLMESLGLLSPREIDQATQYLNFLDNQNNDEVISDLNPVAQRDLDLASKCVLLQKSLDEKKSELIAETEKVDPKLPKSAGLRLRHFVGSYFKWFGILFIFGLTIFLLFGEIKMALTVLVPCIICFILAGTLLDGTKYRDAKVITKIKGLIGGLEKMLADCEKSIADATAATAAQEMAKAELENAKSSFIELNKMHPKLLSYITIGTSAWRAQG